MTENLKPLPSAPGEGRGPRITNPDRPKSSSRSPERHQSPNKLKKKKIVNDDDDEDDFEFFHEFNREKVKDVIHHITTFLKQNAMDIEYLMIPFRPEQNNEKLLKFLNAIFPLGNGQPVNEKSQLKIINKTDVWTLFQSLKYIWCRLPNAEIVGWKAYLKFKYKEIDKKYPQKAFLEIMPQCLESPNHASIVYDFFDLIVTLSSNSRVNKMSARKISKMCAIWAFKRANIKNEDGEDIMHDTSNSPSFDFDANNPKHGTINNSFQDGLNEWIPGSDAMFHLLLAFLKSFVPKDLESSKLPKSLKSILFNNEYPPKGSTAYSSQTILTIPLVTLYTDQFSRKPWQLLERCNELLDFSDYDAFEAREDYALLKSLFKKKNNVEGISRKMSQESRRLMKIMSTKHSTFQAGWAPRQCLANKFDQKENIQIKRVDIDDYFIWSWLSTLSYEETSEKKKIFGRSLILEFEFDGFKKWVIFQECDITLHCESLSQLKDKQLELQGKKEEIEMNIPNEDVKRKPLPKVRDTNPVYEKFQKEVPNISVMQTDHSTLNQPSTTPQGQYHTVIDKSSLQKNNKNNLHTLEEKISKWNPLHNLRKKSNSSASQRSGSESSSEMRTEFASSSVYDPIQSRNATTNVYMEPPSKSEPRVISQYSLLDPQKYKLPAIENEEEGFNIDLSQIGIETDDIQPLTQEPKTNQPPPRRNYNAEIPRNDPHINQSSERVEPHIVAQSTLPLQSKPQPTLPIPQQPMPQQAMPQQPMPQQAMPQHPISQQPMPQHPISQQPMPQQYYEQNLSVQNNVSPPPMLKKPIEPAYRSQTSVASSSNSSTDQRGRYSATETLEELSGMVEDMIIDDDAIKVQAEKTFEDMTKFNQYKPKDFDGEGSISSVTNSLKITTPIDERQRSLQNLNSNVNTTNYRERINFNENTVGADVPIQRDEYQERSTETSDVGYQSASSYQENHSERSNPGYQSGTSYQENQSGRSNVGYQGGTTYQDTGYVSDSAQRGRVDNNQYTTRQNQSTSPVRIPQQPSPNRSPDRGRREQYQSQSPNRYSERGGTTQGQSQSPNRYSERGGTTQGQSQSPNRSPGRGRMTQGQLASQPVHHNNGYMVPQAPPQAQYTQQGRPSMSPARQNASPIRQNMPQFQGQPQMGPMAPGAQYTNASSKVINNKYGQSVAPTAPGPGPAQGYGQGGMADPRMNRAPQGNMYTPNMAGPGPPRGNMNHGLMTKSPLPLQQYAPQPLPQQQYPPQQYQHQHHPLNPGVPNAMPTNRSAQLDGYAGYVHPTMPPINNTNTAAAAAPPPTLIPVAMPHHNNVGMKLHGNNINKRQERKQLYNNIRSGNFGI